MAIRINDAGMMVVSTSGRPVLSVRDDGRIFVFGRKVGTSMLVVRAVAAILSSRLTAENFDG